MAAPSPGPPQNCRSFPPGPRKGPVPDGQVWRRRGPSVTKATYPAVSMRRRLPLGDASQAGSTQWWRLCSASVSILRGEPSTWHRGCEPSVGSLPCVTEMEISRLSVTSPEVEE